MKRLTLALVTLTAGPAFAHADGTIHAHSSTYAALVVGLSVLSAIGVGALVAKRVRK